MNNILGNAIGVALRAFVGSLACVLWIQLHLKVKSFHVWIRVVIRVSRCVIRFMN